MPELPEVETIIRQVRPGLVGRRIRQFRTRWPRQVRPTADSVQAAIHGQRIEDLSRRGKLIVFHLSGGAHLLLHLRMSGRLEWLGADGVEPSHVRALWRLQGDPAATLLFCDARKFGRISWTDDLPAALAHLGPEPLDQGFGPRQLAERLVGRRAIKPLLLDQSRLAGLGNIYVDESLFRARLHPLRRACDLSAAQVEALWQAIRATLQEAIRHNGTSIDWIYPQGKMQAYLRVYGRAGQPCPRCGAGLVKLHVAPRGTQVCPRCQPAP